VNHISQLVDEELALRRDSRHYATLRIGGREIEIERLSGGSFTLAWRSMEDPSVVYAVVDAGVRDKEPVAAAHRRAPRNPHIPKVQRIGHLADGSTVYRMPYYKVGLRANPAEVRSVMDLARCAGRPSHYGPTRQEVLDCARTQKVKPSVLCALEILSEEAARIPGDFAFEFPEDNVAADARGRLVLLDVLYDRNLL